MKKLMLLKIAGLFLILVAWFVFNENKIAAAAGTSSVSAINFANFADEREIFNLINKQRRKSGLNELRRDGDLEKLARNYSRQMADGRFFSHYDRQGNSIVQRARAMKIGGWRRIGENLFKSEPFKKLDKFAVEKWMQSPSHRQNILDRNYNTTGIGIAADREGTIYITQVFTQN